MPQGTGADLVAVTFTTNGTIPLFRLRVLSLLVNGTGILGISSSLGGSNKGWLLQPFVATQTVAVYFGENGLIVAGDPGTVISISIGGLTNATIVYGT